MTLLLIVFKCYFTQLANISAWLGLAWLADGMEYIKTYAVGF